MATEREPSGSPMGRPDNAGGRKLHTSPLGDAGEATLARIGEETRIRDRFQFEIKLHYPVRQDRPVTLHELECYVFIPESLGISANNYSKADFYNDVQAHMRFKTPAVELAAIANADDSPISRLKVNASEVVSDASPTAVTRLEHSVKLFCCILNSSLRAFVDSVAKAADEAERRRLADCYLESVEAITTRLRELGTEILQPAVPQSARSVYAFADEYASLLVERHTFELLEALGGTHSQTLPKRHRAAEALIRGEIRYRKSRGWPSIPRHKSDNEKLIFRRNVLKKFMDSVLFLDTRVRPEGEVVRQTLFGIAAGVSMLFATAILFISQSMYGALTLPVFIALVFGYMFKDRIKESLRVFFSRAAAGFLFDHKTTIFLDPATAIGKCRESFDFVGEPKIPVRIMEIRNRDHITEIESDWLREKVMRYRKRVRLWPKSASAAYRDFETGGIIDIIRFSVANFTGHMGDPRKELFVLEEGGYRRVKAERVYHLNVVLRYGSGDAVRHKRFRIVLNRRKIKRIEVVLDEEF